MSQIIRHRPEQGDGIAPRLAGLRLWLGWFMNLRLAVWLVATFVVVSAGAAFAFDRLQPPAYGAQADIIFQPSGGVSDFRAQRDVGTQPLILRGPAVLGPVSASTGIPVDKLEKAVSVDLLSQSNIVRVTVADPDRATAELVARAITTEYLKRFSPSGSTSIDSAATQLKQEVNQLSSSVSGMLDRLDRLARERPAGQPPSPEERALQATSTATLQRITNLQSQLTALESRRFSDSDVSLLVPAHLLEGRLRPRAVQSLAVGVLVGLFAAAGVAVGALRPLGGLLKTEAIARDGHP
jgi:capsular polysaccharide biosynthesis protein